MKLELKANKKYQVRFNQKEIHFTLAEAFKKLKNKLILVLYKEDKENRNEGYFEIIDKRLKFFACFGETYFISRFIIEEQLELEF